MNFSRLPDKWILVVALLFGGHLVFAQSLLRYEFTAPKMGTEFRLVFYAANEELANEATKASFERIDVLNNIFSDYEQHSELSRLSGSRGKVEVSDELWEVLCLAQQISKASNGAFDVSIGPLSKLWRRAFRQQEFPSEAAIKNAQKRVNYRWIKLKKRSQQVRLKKRNMHLDFGGIAKGYAVDEAMKVLQKYGIKQALVDGGGDILVSAAPPHKTAWTIRVASDTTLTLTDAAVATSGDKYKFLEWNGKRYSHIIHPKTGLGIRDKGQISVLASKCVLADALASTFLLSNEKQSRKLYSKFKIRTFKTEQ